MRFTVFGGILRPGLDLTLDGCLPVTLDAYRRNVEEANARGLPAFAPAQGLRGPLAVVGGGPSVNEHVEELLRFRGETWAINGAYAWCRGKGLDPTFIAIDPHPIVLRWAKGVSKALLGNTCDPGVFDALEDAEVQVIDIGKVIGTSSTATLIPHLAALMGYRSVTFYGCESSYEPGATHAYQDEEHPDEMLVRCGGEDYLTRSYLYRQAQDLSAMIREFPHWLSERSGGLLRAMVEHKDFHISWVCDALTRDLHMIVHEEKRREFMERFLHSVPICGMENGEPIYRRSDLIGSSVQNVNEAA